MPELEWIINTRDTRIWPGRFEEAPRFPYNFITHCAIKGLRFETNAVCNTFQDNGGFRVYLDPFSKGYPWDNRKPKIGEDYENI